MSSKLQLVVDKNLIGKNSIPDFVLPNLQYEVVMGSMAYGVNTDNSDMDIYGFTMPPREVVYPQEYGYVQGFDSPNQFEQWQMHHVDYRDARQKFDFSIYSIIKYFRLVTENNPNMIDSLFVNDVHVLYSGTIGRMVRDKRKIFLHKGAFHKFKGYAYSQLHKMRTKNPEGKRREMVDKYGYDCFSESETEFLTDRGWKKFKDIDITKDRIGSVNIESNTIVFDFPNASIRKLYSGRLYTFNTKNTRCVVTDNHSMLISNAHRGLNCYKYVDNASNWHTKSLAEVLNGRSSWYHLRKKGKSISSDMPVSDEYLMLAGLFLSEGTISFRSGKVKSLRITQTEKGKINLFEEYIEKIGRVFPFKRYKYKKEHVWVFNKSIAKRLYEDFGHYSKEKCFLNKDYFNLSHRQAKLLWDSYFIGDGSRTSQNNGDVNYTTSNQLADDLQALMVSSGYTCTKRGPYKTGTSYGTCEMYQVYLPDDQSETVCTSLKRIGGNYPHSYIDVKNHPVVCFDMKEGTLITRDIESGKISIQGNCKFAYHLVRLLNECEQILTTHDLDLMLNNRQLIDIRNGNWSLEDVENYFKRGEERLEKLYHSSTLPHSPDIVIIKQLLVDCLEEYYGTVGAAYSQSCCSCSIIRELESLVIKHSKRHL
jgi:hypothetical protein